MQKAKVFWSGRSQAVRLPKDFRFDATDVIIRREGDAVIIELPKKPREDDWAWLNDLKGFSKEAIAAMEEDAPWGPDDPESKMTKRSFPKSTR